MYFRSEITPRMITTTRSICLARPSIGNMLIRYKMRMTTRNVMSTLMSIEDPLKAWGRRWQGLTPGDAGRFQLREMAETPRLLQEICSCTVGILSKYLPFMG